MNEDFVNKLNNENVDLLKKRKRGDEPYYATISTATGVLTDYDSFPYSRWFRGKYKSTEPVVAEREAGWRMQNESCYTPDNIPQQNMHYPKHCFETSCSTVYPCMTSFDSDFANSDKRKSIINRECVIQYR